MPLTVVAGERDESPPQRRWVHRVDGERGAAARKAPLPSWAAQSS